MDSNPGSLASGATTLPTVPQPLQSEFFNGPTPASFWLFLFFSSYIPQEKLQTSVGVKLESSEQKASTLTARLPPPRPKILFHHLAQKKCAVLELCLAVPKLRSLYVDSLRGISNVKRIFCLCRLFSQNVSGESFIYTLRPSERLDAAPPSQIGRQMPRNQDRRDKLKQNLRVREIWNILAKEKRPRKIEPIGTLLSRLFQFFGYEIMAQYCMTNLGSQVWSMLLIKLLPLSIKYYSSICTYDQCDQIWRFIGLWESF